MKKRALDRKFAERILSVSSNRHVWCDDVSIYEYHPRKIFVNIPYEPKYARFEQALCTTLITFDFFPVLAKSSRKETVRIDKIIRLIRACKYGVSDLTRTMRHNMCFEHGIMISILGIERCCAIGENRFKVKERLSDIEGFDAKEHKNDPSILVNKLSKWLKDNASADIPPAFEDIEPELIIQALPHVKKYLNSARSYNQLSKDLDSIIVMAMK